MMSRVSPDVDVITFIDMRNDSSGSTIVFATVWESKRIHTSVNDIVNE